MNVVVVDYGGGGNLHSMLKSLTHAAGEVGDGQTVRAVGEPEAVSSADWIVLPGQGAFADCRRAVRDSVGMTEALAEAVLARGRPFLGTCIGMQLMATTSHEMGVHQGFDWIPGDVVRIAPATGVGVARDDAGNIVWPPSGRPWWIPHYGWNDLCLHGPAHPVFAGLGRFSPDVYFVHSYHLRPADSSHLLATVDYGGALTAAVARDNLVGTQFHPEKSQATGLRLLANFLRWRP